MTAEFLGMFSYRPKNLLDFWDLVLPFERQSNFLRRLFSLAFVAFFWICYSCTFSKFAAIMGSFRNFTYSPNFLKPKYFQNYEKLSYVPSVPYRICTQQFQTLLSSKILNTSFSDVHTHLSLPAQLRPVDPTSRSRRDEGCAGPFWAVNRIAGKKYI